MKIYLTVGDVDIKIDTKRIDNNLREAQKLLNMQVAADCEPHIPFSQGALRSSQRYPQGIYGGEIEWDTPYAHYMYKGELYLSESGSSWARKYEAKKPSGKPLKYHHSGTGEAWFEKAKRERLKDWIDLVKREVDRG